MIRLIFSVLMVLSLGCKTVGKSQKASPSNFEVRKSETQVLENGLTIIWVADNTLPYVSMQTMIKSGSSQDPLGKEGLAAFTGAMLEKGTVRRTASKIADDLEQIGSEFGVDVQPDYSIASVSSLSFNREDILSQYAEMILSPSFPVNEIERQRKLALAGLQKLADHASDFTEFLLPKFMYGNHPYGHEASGGISSIKNLKRADLQKFYAENYLPGNSVMAVVGQYDENWKKSLIDAFSKWKSGPSQMREVPAFPVWNGTESLLVNREDLNQAQVQIGMKGMPRNFPDYLEMRAALKILGESFGSRLFEEIREKRGLTYHIHAWADPRVQTGPMGIYTFTRLDKIGETIDETLRVYRDFVANGVTDEEVSQAKALMRAQFPRNFETPEALARQLLLLNRFGIGQDYLTNYLANVDKLNRVAMNAAIKRNFDPSNLKILVYAPRAKAEEVLKKHGKVEVRDYREFLQ